MIRIFGLKNCDTCRKLVKTLTADGVDFAFVDLRTEDFDPALIPGWLADIGGDVLLNRRGTTWRGLPDGEKAEADGDGLADLLIRHRALIKRPVVMEPGKPARIGY